ncbi:MAG: 1,4-dihydroxy-2-naphthoate octaprenyltransferase [Candidatus Omnitrophica bacterium]|nr:1,4-dihydroxy-2-naphthoate octaprenyltransferase [Candidatus Omnitrophota bacterium]
MKNSNPNRLLIWIKAARGYSFTASIIPCLVAASLAFYLHAPVKWLLLLIVITCSVLMHAGTNLINDYYDFKKGVDQNYEFASGRCLVDAVLTPKQAKNSALILFAASFILGLILVALRGPWMLVLGIIGICGGYFYTAMPIGYKYFGLGDVLVFLLMGPLMVIGSYFALTGRFETKALLVSLPIGCLVTAILASNNIRDIKHDTEVKIRTFAAIIGYENAKIEFYLLIIFAYLCVATLAILKILPLWSTAVFFSLPLSIKTITKIKNSQAKDCGKLALIDVSVAQLHLIFGFLLIVSIILGRLISF